jgi:hypothetical protein
MEQEGDKRLLKTKQLAEPIMRQTARRPRRHKNETKTLHNALILVMLFSSMFEE